MHSYRRRALVATSLASILVASLAATSSAAPRPDEYVLPGAAVFPEGVAADNRGTFYVSSTTDGAIFRTDLATATASVWLAGGGNGRSTAIGLELDREGRLLVAGGGTGRVWAYDTADGALIGIFDTGAPGATFINDIAATRSGDAYITDSLRPVISRITAASLASASGGTVAAEAWLDLTGTVIQYQAGFNLNGIVASADGRHLVTVQSNTGRLFRIATADGSVTPIDLGGATVPAGDGLVLRGRTLWVVQNALRQITEVRLAGDLASGTVVGVTTDDSFAFPTTADIAHGSLLVVNSQFDKRGPGLTPELPFTVSRVDVP